MISRQVRSLKERFKRLQKGRLRWVVAVVATVQQSIKNLSPVLIYVDEDGDWCNRRRGVSLVSPELNVASAEAVESAVMDLWCYDCKLHAGDTVVDVGAGIGDDAVVFSRLVGTGGRVIAIEAHPRTYRCLLKTIAANRLGNVIAINAAVSDTNGELAISDGENFLSNSIHAGVSTVIVKARTLGEILRAARAPAPDLVKMNIEGAETTALQGMKDVLQATRRVVISCHDFKADRGESPQFRTHASVNRLLLEAGFDLRGREGDPRPEVRYYVYGARAESSALGGNPRPATA